MASRSSFIAAASLGAPKAGATRSAKAMASPTRKTRFGERQHTPTSPCATGSHLGQDRSRSPRLLRFAETLFDLYLHRYGCSDATIWNRGAGPRMLTATKPMRDGCCGRRAPRRPEASFGLGHNVPTT